MSGILIIAALGLIVWTTRRLIAGVKRNLYQYENIRRMGLLIFLGVFLVWNTVNFITDLKNGRPTSLYIMVMDIKDSVALFALFMFPVALITSVLVTVSNAVLLKKEGRTWKNLLGLILGGFICASTVFLVFGTSGQPYRNEFSAMLVDYLYYLYALIIAYLECILIGTIAMGIIAAKHIPHYDKDYVIIPGCQIRKDGSLTPLLRARVDRAMEFAAAQKEKTGKEPVFVVSGGKGADEIISEADAMRNYLLTSGIEDSRIVNENKSRNTEENIRFSAGLIKQEKNPARIAFSTTNYHVFRTGNIAWESGFDMEGVGAKTKSYFWINAFIREFIATLVSEKKKHLVTLGLLALALFLIQIYVY